MTNSSNIAVTDFRLKQALSRATELATGIQNKDVDKAVKEQAKLKIGVLTEYYASLNQCKVKLLNENKTVECRVNHIIIGKEANLSYTPEGRKLLSSDESQYYIKPRNTLYCAVLEINSNKDVKDYFLVGYITNGDYDAVANPNPGELLLQVGENSVNISKSRISVNTHALYINGLPYTEAKGEIEKLDNFYSQEYVDEHYYNKYEIDKLLDDLKKELKGE